VQPGADKGMVAIGAVAAVTAQGNEQGEQGRVDGFL
jgi:hypothetical protein